MITVGMNYKVLSGKETIFENAFRQVAEKMRETEGHQETRLYKDIDESQSYLIVSEWTSRDAFNTFIASEQFKKVTNWGTTQVLAGRPKHEVYEK
ncbi:MAG: antibiotic biosynthesis monooxygenase [SAR324 cluster bacterium]|nr:antibiotic biosynthesis monooxygenase [SAR324 cluster bacterium]